MRKQILVLVAASLACLTIAGDSPAESMIKKCHDDFAKAMRNSDAKAARKVVIDHFQADFVHKLQNGQTENRESFIKNMGVNPTVKFVGFKFTYGKAVTKGNSLTLPVTAIVKAQMKDPKGKVHIMDGFTDATETWVKSGSEWKMKSMTDIHGAQTFDGKKSG